MIKKASKDDSVQELSVVQSIQTMSELLKGGDQEPVEFELGDLVEGAVVSVVKGKIVIDLGNVATGIIVGTETMDSSNTLKDLKAGDKVQAVVIGEENEDGQLVLSLKRAAQESTWDNFMKRYNDSETFEIKIREANKGGLLVEEDGIRGFIPVSQLTPEHYPRVEGGDSSRILSKLEKLMNTMMKVKVINYDEKERRLILSEKAAYRDQRQAIVSKLKVGEQIKGRVSGIVNFGIFVNYEGIEGLVHISEIAWGHVADPKKYARVGDEINVLVIGVENDKISFSMKKLTKDPWAEIVDKYKIGQEVKGPITRITPFGAFVKLEDEVEGLIHLSEFSVNEEVVDPNSILETGETVEAKILTVDLEEHRLGLSIKGTPLGKKIEKELVNLTKSDKAKKTKAPKEESVSEDVKEKK
ncbi:MAG: S1 RNA-binding domain-containing protein [Candidatus Gracilibacteria bacterium]|nr:S1 RNA-binding domain-containing protein [Candidatus Gracilibacteria bacterium]